MPALGSGRSRVLGLALVAVAILVDITACAYLAAAMGATNDLFPRWTGTRLWLTEGVSPYAPAVEAEVRRAMGSIPGGDEGPFVFGFVYPGYVAVLLAPLALLPFHVAATIWLLLIQACVLFGAAFCWRACERDTTVPRASLLPALATAVLFPGGIFNVLFLQFSALVFLALGASWWLLRRRPALGGAVLALAFVKPALAVLPATALLGWAVYHRGWRYVAGFAASGTALVTLSVLVIPSWPAEFLESTRTYAAAATPQSAATIVASVLAGLTGSSDLVPILVVIVGALALGALAGNWWRSARAPGDALAAGALAGAWVVPPLYEWNNVVLLVAWLPVLRFLVSRNPRAVGAFVVLQMAAGVLTAFAYAGDPNAARLIWPLLSLGALVLATARQQTSSPAAAPRPPAPQPLPPAARG